MWTVGCLRAATGFSNVIDIEVQSEVQWAVTFTTESEGYKRNSINTWAVGKGPEFHLFCLVKTRPRSCFLRTPSIYRTFPYAGRASLSN